MFTYSTGLLSVYKYKEDKIFGGTLLSPRNPEQSPHAE